MIGKIIQLLNSDPIADAGQEHERIQVATCALLLEMAHADKSLHELEEQLVHDIIAEKFDLSPESVQELAEYAQQERAESVDLFRFARVIGDFDFLCLVFRIILNHQFEGLEHTHGPGSRLV